MRSMSRAFYAKPLALYLTVALIVLTSFAAPAEAMFLSSVQQVASQDRADAVSSGRDAELSRVQALLESKMIQQKLMDYGLSSKDAMVRLEKLSDEQVHQLAANMDSLQAGADGGYTVGAFIIIAMLAVLLVFMVQGRIEIK